jgi:TRAP-type C4-dicarboxylate transport system permease large subunit
VNLDTELESWKQEWRAHSDPMPDAELPVLKKKIKRQDQRAALAIAATGVCLILSTFAAWKLRTPFLSGLASGIWFGSLTMGAYAWSVRRGAWKPAAETTTAYAELSYKRAIARERTARFAFWLLLVATVLYGGFLAWDGKGTSARFVAIFVAMTAETFWLHTIARRKKREIETTRRLVESCREN